MVRPWNSLRAIVDKRAAAWISHNLLALEEVLFRLI